MRKILFLDIDGVLHGDFNEKLSRTPVLEQYLLRMPALDIVISSTWREDHSLDELRALFAEPLRPRVIGVTPILEEGYDRSGREREIEAYLAAEGLHAGNARWIALDDWPHLFDEGCAFLVVTDARHGFDHAQGEILLAWYASTVGAA